MNRTHGLILGGAGVLGAVLTATAVADDGSEHGFDNRSIKGNWGYVSTLGNLLPPVVPATVQTAAVGRIHFDGEGGCAVASTVNVDGKTATFKSSSCHYSVNADGTGSSEATFPTSPIAEPVPVSFVITERGREIFFLNTRFLISTFVAHRQ